VLNPPGGAPPPPPTATRVTFATQPSSVTAGSAISPAVQVAAQNDAGQTITSFTGNITVAIGTNPGGGTLSGTTSAAAVNGVATFSNLSINKAGTGYTLTAASTGLAGATSGAFNVTAGAVSASQSTVSASPTTITAGTGTSTVTVTARDVNANPISGATVVLAATGSGNTLTQPAGPTNGSGVATGTLSSTVAEPKTVSATINGIAVTQTATVTVSSGTGDLAVTTSTSGSSLDPDGYSVAVDGGPAQAIGINGTFTFTSLSAGNHSVALSGVASNCTVSGSNPRTVSVPSGGTGSTTFSVTCSALVGNLDVTTSTSGSSLDPDGYSVAVDGGAGQAIGINGTVSFTNLPAGNHSVGLSGVAGNCTVSGSNPRTISVPSGGTASTTFTVSCSTSPGNLAVTTSTTGSSLDPDGYTVAVDGGAGQAIGINSSFTFTNLAAGNHSVALSGVASNCTVSGSNPRTISVPSGGTANTTFSVTCTTPPGNLAVSTSTTGSSLDPNGYTVAVDGGAGQAIGINSSFTFTNLSAGNHSVAVSGVASNCTVSGSNPRTISVPSGGTANTTFSVSCVTPNTAPVVNAGPDQNALTGLLFSESWSFTDPDNGPWNYTIDWGDGSTTSGSKTSAGSFSNGHTYVIVLPRSFTIRITVTDSMGASHTDTKVVSVLLL
jgi:hypothetical protein